MKLSFYFAHPYSARERGTNENDKKLWRQYFLKVTNIEEITDAQLEHTLEKLNHRPRKTIGFQTPSEILNKSVALTS